MGGGGWEVGGRWGCDLQSIFAEPTKMLLPSTTQNLVCTMPLPSTSVMLIDLRATLLGCSDARAALSSSGKLLLGTLCTMRRATPRAAAADRASNTSCPSYRCTRGGSAKGKQKIVTLCMHLSAESGVAAREGPVEGGDVDGSCSSVAALQCFAWRC